jgi:hypothetical protein
MMFPFGSFFVIDFLIRFRTDMHRIMPAGYINDHHSPHSHHHIQSKPHIPRGSSETSFNLHHATPQPPIQVFQRTNSDVVQPKPVSVGVNMSQLQGRGQAGGKVNWKLGSED